MPLRAQAILPHPLVAVCVLVPVLAAVPRQSAAQQAGAARADPQHELLERLTGHWVLRGIIARQQTTHDVDAQWVLGKEYVQIHEVSREKDATGKPQYEAIVYIAWDSKAGEYTCLWLDTTGVFAPDGVGRAKPAPDSIPILIKDPDGGIHTTFVYDRANDSWTWTIDNEDKGKLTPFARLKLTRS